MTEQDNSHTRENAASGRTLASSPHDEKTEVITAWANQHLNKAGYTDYLITDLVDDMADGITLLRLVESLLGKPLPPHHTNPVLKVQKRENIQVCLKLLKQLGILNPSILVEDIVAGNLKTILTVCHLLRTYYSETPSLMRTQQEVPVHRSNTLPSYVQRTTRLATSLDRGDVETLNWIGALVHRNIADYTSLSDGLILCELINAIQEGALPIEELHVLPPLQRLQIAFTTAERYLGITKGSIDLGQLLHGHEIYKLKTYLQHLQVIYAHRKMRPKPRSASVSFHTGTHSSEPPRANSHRRHTGFDHVADNVERRHSSSHENRLTSDEHPLHAGIHSRDVRIRSRSFGRSSEDLRSATRLSSKHSRPNHDQHSKSGSRVKERYLSEIDLTAATSLAGYSPKNRKSHHPLEAFKKSTQHANGGVGSGAHLHRSEAEPSSSSTSPDPRTPTTPTEHYQHRQSSKDKAVFLFPSATQTPSPTGSIHTDSDGALATSGSVPSDQTTARIDDLNERLRELSIVFSRERDEIISKLTKIAAQEKRRRMKLEASQARMLKRMEEAVKHYDECFVLLAKDVAQIKEELAVANRQSDVTASLEQQLQALNLKVNSIQEQMEDSNKLHSQAMQQQVQEAQRTGNRTPGSHERSRKTFFKKKA